MNFHEISYKLHEDEKHTQTESCSLDLYRNWFDSDTVDLWRHLRMLNCLDPLLEEFPGVRWLTVGDGTYGTSSVYIEKKGGHALPVDINVSLLEVARQSGIIGDYKKENAEALSFPADSFDFAFCKESYHHFPRPVLAMYEMLRVSRKAVILVEPADWLPSPVPRRILQSVKNRLKELFKREIPHPDTGNFEPIGNYVYNVSEREIQKIALALNLPAVAFKRFHDVYIEGVEFEKANDQSKLLRKIRSGISRNDLLSRLGLSCQNHIAAVIFKTPPESRVRTRLKDAGYRVIDSPKNPYFNTPQEGP